MEAHQSWRCYDYSWTPNNVISRMLFSRFFNYQVFITKNENNAPIKLANDS